MIVRDEMLEKPADAADALRMLGKLQGRTHQVVTSVALAAARRIHQATDVTNVTFRRIDDDFLRAYVATGEPMDKAGAYGIQGTGRRWSSGSRGLLRGDGPADPAGACDCWRRRGSATCSGRDGPAMINR